MADNSQPTGLQDFPFEILDEVAGYLSKTSVHSLCLASKTIEANTYQTFVDNNFKDLSIDLFLPNIKYVLSLMRTPNVACQVKHITFTDTKSTWYATGQTRSDDEVYTLLKETLSLLPPLTSMSIVGHSTTIAQVFRLLGEDSPHRLTSFSMRGCHISAKSISDVLRCHKDSLRSMVLDNVRCPCSSWHSTLELMRDELNLDTLALNGFLSNNTYMNMTAFLWQPGRQYNRTIRDPVLRKIQFHSITHCTARMMGELAVKEGLEFILPRLTDYNIGQLLRAQIDAVGQLIPGV